MDPSPLQRALAGAPERAPAPVPPPEQEFFCFRLGEVELGVPSDAVREVLRAGRVTPLPRSPPYLLGVTGHRGEVLPVIDLLRFLGKGETRPGPRGRIFVGAVGPYVAGVLVDSVIGLRRIQTANVLPAPVGGDVSADHLIGIVQQAGAVPGASSTAVLTKGVISLIHFAKLLQTARQRAVAR